MDEVIAAALSDLSGSDKGNQGFHLQEQYARVCLENGTGLYSETPIKSPEDAVRVMADVMSGMDGEYVVVVNLNNLTQPIGYTVVAIGKIGTALFNQINIFKTAILSNAVGIIVLHNHPSGNLRPSKDDLAVTARINVLAKLFDINFLDHVIIGTNGKTNSLAGSCPDLFTNEPVDMLNRWVSSRYKSAKNII